MTCCSSGDLPPQDGKVVIDPQGPWPVLFESFLLCFHMRSPFSSLLAGVSYKSVCHQMGRSSAAQVLRSQEAAKGGLPWASGPLGVDAARMLCRSLGLWSQLFFSLPSYGLVELVSPWHRPSWASDSCWGRKGWRTRLVQ